MSDVPRQQKPISAPVIRRKIKVLVTWIGFIEYAKAYNNLQGIKSVKDQLEYMLNSYQPVLLTLQETMLTDKSSRCRLQGYTCVEVKHKIKKGGRGLLTAVRNTAGLTISEYRSNPYWMATKVSGTLTSNNKIEMMVINVHIPSSSTKKKQVTEQIATFARNYKLKHPGHIILVMGDFNMKTDAAVKYTTKIGVGLQRAKTMNSPGSRVVNGKIGNMIDHIMYSGITHRPLG
ncbi:hypothetical protein BB561_003865 [Smittium simulii]|uniref:Endonuclease/exonuclease/phosphatase domain-containing protein n=1 Tax=Smittium simulii TaxID=133385 RepID=A0A2T9YJC0_9FUNG|nr:hypothetical protein BB561_003865 [Smittium simulii]